MQKNYKYDVSVEMFTPSSQTIMDKLKILSELNMMYLVVAQE